MDKEKKDPDARPEKKTREKTGKTPGRSRDRRTRQIQRDVSTCTEEEDVPEEPFDHRATVIQYVEEQRRRDMSSSPPQEENMAYPILLSFLRGLTDRQWRNVRNRIRDGTTRARLARESERIVKVVAQSIFHILFPAMLVMLEVDALRRADSSSSLLTVRTPVDDPLQKYFNLTEESLAQTIRSVSSPIAKSLLGDVVRQLNQGLSVLVACTPSEISVLTTDPSSSVQQSRKQATEVIADTLHRYSVAESCMLGNVVEKKVVVQEATLNPLNSEELMKSIADSLESSNGRRGRGRAGAMEIMRKLSDICNVFSGYEGSLSPSVVPQTRKMPKKAMRSRFNMRSFGSEVPTQKQSVLNSPGFYSKTSLTVGRVLRTLMCCACSPSFSSSSSFSSSMISLRTSSSYSCSFHMSEGTPPPVSPRVETAATGLIQGFVKEVQGGARSVQEEEEQRGEPLSEEAVKARVQSDANLVFLTMKEKVTEFFRPRPDLTSKADPEEHFMSRAPSQDLFPSPSSHSWVVWPDSVSNLDDQDVEQVTGRVLKNIVDSCKTILTRLEVAGEGSWHAPAPKLMPYMGRLFSRLSGLTATAHGNAPGQEVEAEPPGATCSATGSFPAAPSQGVANLKKLSDQGFQANAAARVSEVLLGRDGNVVPKETEAHLDAEAYRLVEGFVAQVVAQAREITTAMETRDSAREDQVKTVSLPGESVTQDDPSSTLKKPSRKELIRHASLKLCQSMQSRLAFLLLNRSPHQPGCSSEEEEEVKDEEEEEPEWNGSADTQSSVGSVSSGSRGGDGRTGGGGGSTGGSGGGSPSSMNVSQDSMAHLELGTDLIVSQILCSFKKELGISSSPAKGAAACCRGSDHSAEEVCVSDIVDHLDDAPASGGLPPALSNVSTNKDSLTIWPPSSPLAPTSTKGPDLLNPSLATATSVEFHTQAPRAVQEALLRSLEEVTRLPPASSCSRGAQQSGTHYTLRPMDVEQVASEVVRSLVSALESADRSAVASPPGRSRTVAQSLQLCQMIQNQLNWFYQRVLVPAPPGPGTGAAKRNVSVSETALIRDTQQGGACVALGNASSMRVLSGASSVDNVTLPVAQSSGPMVSQNFLDRQTNEVVQRLVTSHKSVMSAGGRDTTERTRRSPSESDCVANVLSWMDNFSSRTLPERAWSPVNAADQNKPGSSTVSPGAPDKVEHVFSGVNDEGVPHHRSSETVLRDRSTAQLHTPTVDRLRGLILKCMGRFSFPDPSSVTGGSSVLLRVSSSPSSSSSLLETASSELLDTAVSDESRMVVDEGSESYDSPEITDSSLLEHSSSLDSVGSKGDTYPGAPASYRRLQEKLREVQQSLCQDRSTLPWVSGSKTTEPSLVNQIKAPVVEGLLGSYRKPSSASSSKASSTKCGSKGHRSPQSFKSMGLSATKLPRETPVKSQSKGSRAKICWSRTNRKRGGSTRRPTDDTAGQMGSPSVLSPDVDPARAALGRLKELVEQGTLRPLVTQLLEQLQALLEDSQPAPYGPGPVRKSRSDPVLSERHRLRREVPSGSSAEYELLFSFVEETIERLLLTVPLPPSSEEKVPPPLPSSSSSSSECRAAPGRQKGVPGHASTSGACPATPVVQSQLYDRVVNVYSQVIVEQVLGSLSRLYDTQADTADQGKDDTSGSGRNRDADCSNAGSSRGRSVSASEVEEEDNQDEGAGTWKTHGRSSLSEVKESIMDAVQRLRRVWKRRNAVSSATFLTNQTSLREVVSPPVAPVVMPDVERGGPLCSQQEQRTAGHFPIRIFSTRRSGPLDLPRRSTTAP